MHVRIAKYLACLLIVAATALMGVLVFGYMSHDSISASSVSDSTSSTTNQPAAKTATVNTLSSLVPALTATLNSSDVSASVSVIDIASGKQYNAGLEVPFRGASTTKVLTAVAYMHRVEQGTATLSTQINGASAQTMLQSMLQQSNNAAWSAFNDYLGKPNLEAYAHSIGLSSFSVSDNTITAEDDAQLLAQLYGHHLISAEHSRLLMSFMQDTDNERLIPAALPAEATVYHKYGYLEGELHDSAIITYQGHTFVVVIFTNNQRTTIDDSATRMQLIHALTNDVITQYEAKS
jgi:beta-lactamase class A